jgi:D-xylose 1-dehydrogenase (NADP+, D-xylono-1,5-lactone-forming)
MSDNAPVRWGILGTAGISAKFIAGVSQSSEATIVAVGSRTAERAEAFAAEHGIARAHPSYDDLLEDPLVEAVYVCLPNTLHHPWTMRALAARKHVLCEKPYSRRPDEVVAAFDLAERAGLVLSEGFMWRHHPQVRRLLELLPEIGRLETIRATFSFVLDDPGDIRLRADLEGGSLMDVGCYCVSGARLLAGEEPDLVYGSAVTGPTDVDIRFTGILRFPSGAVAEFSSGLTTDHRGLEGIGTAGSVRLVDPWHARPATIVHDGVELAAESADPYQLEVEDIGAAIRRRRAPLLGRADALGQARTIDALLHSAEAGHPLRL